MEGLFHRTEYPELRVVIQISETRVKSSIICAFLRNSGAGCSPSRAQRRTLELQFWVYIKKCLNRIFCETNFVLVTQNIIENSLGNKSSTTVITVPISIHHKDMYVQGRISIPTLGEIEVTLSLRYLPT